MSPTASQPRRKCSRYSPSANGSSLKEAYNSSNGGQSYQLRLVMPRKTKRASSDIKKKKRSACHLLTEGSKMGIR